jgi:hypothetical protein
MTQEKKAQIRANLTELSSSIDWNERSLIHEFLREEELGLALQTLCDGLLSNRAVAIDGKRLAQIADLFAEMGLDDEGVLEALREPKK